MKKQEGYLDINSQKTWYAVYGDLKSKLTPIILLHGGPGFPHYHLQNLTELAKTGRPVIIYDQIGCGKSDRIDDPSIWTISLFINELVELRKHLKLDKLVILGHSWGGSLAAEYMLTKPSGITKLILSSPLLDSKLWVSETDKLKDQLPKWAADTMRSHEADGTTDSPEYADAYIEFKNNFICRIQPYPDLLVQSDKEYGEQVYVTMWGPSESYATGNLKNWSVIDRLKEINIPTLFLSGKYDEATPAQIKLAQSKIENSKWIMFENSSHTANLEEPELYMKTLEDFLNEDNENEKEA